jgi:hypothetical protein
MASPGNNLRHRCLRCGLDWSFARDSRRPSCHCHLTPLSVKTLVRLAVSLRPGYGGVVLPQSVATPAHLAIFRPATACWSCLSLPVSHQPLAPRSVGVLIANMGKWRSWCLGWVRTCPGVRNRTIGGTTSAFARSLQSPQLNHSGSPLPQHAACWGRGGGGEGADPQVTDDERDA